MLNFQRSYIWQICLSGALQKITEGCGLLIGTIGEIYEDDIIKVTDIIRAYLDK